MGNAETAPFGAAGNKTSIILVTYNNLEYTKTCIESIRAFTPKGTYEVIAADNASSDGTPGWLAAQQDVKSILNAENLGFPAGCNQGIASAEKGNDIMLLNNDTIVTPRWLENLRACLYADESTGAVGAVTNSCSNLQTITANYGSIDEMLKFADSNNIKDPSKWEDRIRLIGFCMLIRRTAVEKLGLLDERFTPGNYEDDDYSLRLRLAGYRLVLCGDCFIHHFGSTSFGKGNKDFSGLLEKNRRKFLEKWGFDPILMSVDERRLISGKLGELGSPARILQYGCGCGGTLLYLKQRFPAAEVCGVEKNSRLTAGLAHLTRIEGSLEGLEGESFVLVLLSGFGMPDEDAVTAARELKPYLSQNGVLMVTTSHTDRMAGEVRELFQEAVVETDPSLIVVRPDAVKVSVKSFSKLQLEKIQFGLEGCEAGGKSFEYLLRRLENGIDPEESERLLEKAVNGGGLNPERIREAVEAAAIDKKAAFSRIHALRMAGRAAPEDICAHIAELLNGAYIDEDEATVRRLEELLRQGGADARLLAEAIELRAYDRAVSLCTAGALLYNCELKDQALYLFIEGYKFNTQNRDLAYNLSVALFERGGRKEALEVLAGLKNPDNEIVELTRRMAGSD